MPRDRRPTPFISILRRDADTYDYAELIRVLTFDPKITLNLIRDRARTIKNYADNVLCHLESGSCIEIVDTLNSYKMELTLKNSNSLIFYASKGSKQAYLVNLHDFAFEKPKVRALKLECPPSTWIRGLLRYTLSKVITIYILSKVADKGEEAVLSALVILNTVLLHDDVAFLFKYSQPFVWLPSLLFGCGDLKGLVAIRELEPSSNGTCTYELAFNVADTLALMFFQRLVNKVCEGVLRTDSKLEAFRCIAGILSIVAAAMGVSIPGLKGPLVPPTARFRDLKGKSLSSVVLRVPDVGVDRSRLVEMGGLLLRKYSEYVAAGVGV